MNLKQFTLSCILTTIVMAIEILAATTGELFVLLTVASALPIYIICRQNLTFGISSYVCVAILLLLINPHQLIFFVFINGLLGITLGYCDRKNNQGIFLILISVPVLFFGTIMALWFIGVSIDIWYIILLLVFFSIVYVSVYFFIARKAYEKFNKFM